MLVRGSSIARYLPSGHLVYINKGTLFAIPFDLNRLETRGTAVPVLDDVAFEPRNGAADLYFSETGTLVYRRGSVGGGTRMMTIQWVDGAGKKEPLLAKPGAYSDLWISPDGKRLSFVVTEGASQSVWVYDPQRDAMTKRRSTQVSPTHHRSGARTVDTSFSAPSGSGCTGRVRTGPASRSP
jgi:eukaryotic-like serine/threonine-protein kinase